MILLIKFKVFYVDFYVEKIYFRETVDKSKFNGLHTDHLSALVISEPVNIKDDIKYNILINDLNSRMS